MRSPTTTHRALLSWPVVLVLAGAWLRVIAPIPPLVLFAALMPAACYAGLIALVDRGKRPAAALLAMLCWGAVVAAPLSRGLNGVTQEWLAGITDAVWPSPLLAAPVVEEGVKAAGLLVVLLLWRQQFTGVLDGIVYGAFIGIGFTATENIDYFMLAAVQGGEPGLARSIYLRAVLEGLNHASFAALTGAGVGYAWTTRWARWRVMAPAIGLGAAVLQHARWNAIAAPMITATLCNPAIPGGPCSVAPTAAGLVFRIPLVIAACIGPGVVIVTVIAVAVRRRGVDPTPRRREE